jgi:hypothetical protein
MYIPILEKIKEADETTEILFSLSNEMSVSVFLRTDIGRSCYKGTKNTRLK